MHYKNGELYFYLKKVYDKDKLNEINKHIESCSECRTRLDKISGISMLFKKTMEKPPEFNPSVYTVKSDKTAGHAFFKVRAALAAVLLAFFCVAAVIGYFFSMHEKRENAAKIIYKNYSVIYNFDSYKEQYLNRTKIINMKRN
jgi:predicted anti-sigma-YlaC factor YlaD